MTISSTQSCIPTTLIDNTTNTTTTISISISASTVGNEITMSSNKQCSLSAKITTDTLPAVARYYQDILDKPSTLCDAHRCGWYMSRPCEESPMSPSQWYCEPILVNDKHIEADRDVSALNAQFEVTPSTFGVSTKSKKCIPVRYDRSQRGREKNVLGVFTCTRHDRQLLKPEEYAYAIEIMGHTYLPDVDHWCRYMNHSIQFANVHITASGMIVQDENIIKGDELLWDYGVDYWCWAVLRLDYDSLDNSIMWKHIYKHTDDYTELLQLDLSRIPENQRLDAAEHWYRHKHGH